VELTNAGQHNERRRKYYDATNNSGAGNITAPRRDEKKWTVGAIINRPF
jgi:hypothetical protein